VANRFLSRWAQGAALAHQGTAADLRCPGYVTGVPVRSAFLDVGQPAAPAAPLRVLVLGGSQGAQQLNALVPAAFESAGLSAAVRHQAGEAAAESARAAWREASTAGIEAEVVPFIDDVASAMAWSHLVVSRAGAITVAEISAAGRASILVPLAAAGAHQLDNALAAAEAGAALLLAGAAVSAERLGRLLSDLAGDPERLATMGRAARSLARPRAAAAIADLVEGLEVAA
jgi:UDP-N-acetylglucosamine--N-acetylmuramyl-(pentapeptide) pyrophosphoryl-undecaprenol N-acetylglucosamine transferase